MTKEINPNNKCSNLYKEVNDYGIDKLESIFKLQGDLQIRLEPRYDYLINKDIMGVHKISEIQYRCDKIINNWTYMSVEYGELLTRLPFKSWKRYSEDGMIFFSDTDVLEIEYEFVDMLHFFINIALSLGITPKKLYNLYVTKNMENHNRQNNNY